MFVGSIMGWFSACEQFFKNCSLPHELVSGERVRGSGQEWVVMASKSDESVAALR